MYRFMLVLLLVASMVMADEIVLNRDVQATQIKIAADNLQVRDASSLLIQAQVRSLTVEDVETPAGTFTHLYIPGWQYTNNPGEPQLPVMSKIVQVPMGGALSVRLVTANKYEGMARDYGIQHTLFPCQPSYRKDQTEIPFVYNRDAYQTSFRSMPLVSVEEIGMMRNARLAMISFHPVEYSPVDGKISFYTDLTAELVVENVDWEATQTLNQTASSALAFTSNQIMTPASLATTAQRGLGYLIVAHQLFQGNALLNNFIAYKESLGYNVVVKYIATSTVDQVLAVIKAEYAVSKPSFLLLIGDNEQIPGKNVGQYTDLYYASTMVGGDSDYLPDMLYGRFSATTDVELNPQIEKTLAYEKRQFPDAGAFLSKYTLVAGWDSSWAKKRGYPQIRYAYKYYFNETKGYAKPVETGAGQNVFLSAGSQAGTQAIVKSISDGVGFFNYTAHGSQTNFSDPSFTITNINSLTNINKYPLVIGNCCLTGSFQVTTCFGEAWLRAKDKGAIGFIGGSNYTYWDEDLWFGTGYCPLPSGGPIDQGQSPIKENTTPGMYEAGFGEFASNMPVQISTNAAVMVAGNLAVQASTSSRKLYYWQVYHLFGDPSLPCYWAK